QKPTLSPTHLESALLQEAVIPAKIIRVRKEPMICQSMTSADSRLSVQSPTHFPEFGFEPGGFLKDHDQLCLAGRRGVAIGETLQMRPRFRRDVLVWCTGILGDPNAIWVR